jgi:hypothetical protein
VNPHIHVERNLNRHAATRSMLAATFGLVADSPPTVTTGCGLEVAYAMTSARPESVTCLPCREHAARWHIANAEDLEQLRAAEVTGPGLAGGAEHHRSQARKFAG